MIHKGVMTSIPSAEARRHPQAALRTWPLTLMIGCLILYWIAPYTGSYPAAPIALVVYGLALYALTRRGAVRGGLLTPMGWTVFLFATSLVAGPLLIAFFGPYQSVLPFLPSAGTINQALVVMIVSFVAFCCGYLFSYRRGCARGRRSGRLTPWTLPPRGFVAAYLCLGALGLVLAFRSLGGIATYFASPSLARESVLNATSTSVGLAANILKPFLGVALILVWCRRLDRAKRPRPVLDSMTTLGIVLLVLVAYGTFSYNRGSFAIPIVSILAVYSRRVHRLGALGLITMAAVGVVVLSAVGLYRSSDLTSSQLLSRQGLAIVGKNLDINRQIQVYGNGPQFLGFLLENSAGSPPALGRASASAVLSPIPVLGRAFRPTSGAFIYNRWIYGSLVGGAYLGDQVVPFTGELSLDFKIPGIVIGFLFVGAVFGRLQLRFEGSTTALELYVTQFTSMWIAFLVIGSLEVVSQIFVFFFWPIYILVGYQLLKRQTPYTAHVSARPTSVQGARYLQTP